MVLDGDGHQFLIPGFFLVRGRLLGKQMFFHEVDGELFPEWWVAAEFAPQMAVRESLFVCGYRVAAFATMAFHPFQFPDIPAALASHSKPSLDLSNVKDSIWR